MIARWLTTYPAIAFACLLLSVGPARAQPWRRHVVDDSSRGADGVRLADVNGDGLPDVATGWEEGGLVRAYLNPGPPDCRKRWPAVTVGRVRSPEDAVFADVDGDGAFDVVSSCEGHTRAVFVHWAPKRPADYLNAGRWRTEAFPALTGKSCWMFALPMQIDGIDGVDLIVGSKDPGGQIGWLQSPEDPTQLADWRYHRLRTAGWIMSLAASDFDNDGDADLLASDRKGDARGAFWLENPGPERADREDWTEHAIGGTDLEMMFLTLADLDADDRIDVLATTRAGVLLFFRRTGRPADAWQTHRITLPFDLPWGKAISTADVDLDGRLDVVTNNRGPAGSRCLAWMNYQNSPTESRWQVHDVGGTTGSKFDLIEMLDLDADGDLDLLTCEERDNLGVVWYENPTK